MNNKNDIEKIIMFDTSISSDNIGDEIIMNSIYNEMNKLFEKYMVMKFSTHTPVMHIFQFLSNSDPMFGYFTDSKYKFIGGTNIFKKTLKVRRADWNLNKFDSKFYKGSITIGCGCSFKEFKLDRYTINLYKKILNPNYIHSTRDEKTKLFLEYLGYRAINTGCPTLWSITEGVCKDIPKYKSNSVVFTLTGYNQDITNDTKLVNIIMDNYNSVYFWPQSIGDLCYLKSLNIKEKITVLNPTLESLKYKLKNGNIDYIGTRLHGGIFALQNRCKSIIISIDNRAEDMDKINNLRCIKREDVEKELPVRINEVYSTNIIVDFEAINKWKGQFS